MRRSFIQCSLLSALLCGASLTASAAETTINGFASFVGGMALNQQELPNGCDTVYYADPGYAKMPIGEPGTKCNGDLDTTPTQHDNKNAAYGNEFSYHPDSNYGLQFKSDLNHDLSVTAQLTGRGSQEFEPVLEWAYLSYDLNPDVTLQVGRQRLPLYYYSDFFDVGYAYHWIRPPVDVYSNTLNLYEGVSLTHRGSFGSWSTQTRIYTGSTGNETSRFGDVNSDGVIGGVFDINNDYLRIRASIMDGEFYVKGTDTDNSNDQSGYFGSLAAHLTLGDFFAIAETTLAGFHDDESYFGTNSPVNANLQSLDSMMISLGWQLGDFTPHLSWSQNNIYLTDMYLVDPSTGAPVIGASGPVTVSDEVSAAQTITAGLRWDFHPSSAFKVEFSSRADDSTDYVTALSGETNSVDVVSLGFDVIF